MKNTEKEQKLTRGEWYVTLVIMNQTTISTFFLANIFFLSELSNEVKEDGSFPEEWLAFSFSQSQ